MGKKRKGKAKHAQRKRAKNARSQKGSVLSARGGSNRGTAPRKPALVVANPSGQQAVTTIDLNPQRLSLYKSTCRILLVGEGNFTFAAALATKLGGANLTATGLDAKKLVLQKYEEDAKRALSILRSTQAHTLFGFDATEQASFTELLPKKKFEYVVFNFPHVGGSTPEDVSKNREVLRGFFRCSRRALSERGEIHVSLRDTPFYNSWKIERIAGEAGLVLVKSEHFDSEAFAALGYVEVNICYHVAMKYIGPQPVRSI